MKNKASQNKRYLRGSVGTISVSEAKSTPSSPTGGVSDTCPDSAVRASVSVRCTSSCLSSSCSVSITGAEGTGTSKSRGGALGTATLSSNGGADGPSPGSIFAMS